MAQKVIATFSNKFVCSGISQLRFIHPPNVDDMAFELVVFVTSTTFLTVPFYRRAETNRRKTVTQAATRQKMLAKQSKATNEKFSTQKDRFREIWHIFCHCDKGFFSTHCSFHENITLLELAMPFVWTHLSELKFQLIFLTTRAIADCPCSAEKAIVWIYNMRWLLSYANNLATNFYFALRTMDGCLLCNCVFCRCQKVQWRQANTSFNGIFL